MVIKAGNLTKRKAVAMIELIFAIVVMGIAMLSIPIITIQSAKSGESTIMQESVAAAAAQMQMILSRHWDEVDADPSLGSRRPILQTDSANFNNKAGLNINGRTDQVNGIEYNASKAVNFLDGGDNDIDDYNGIVTPLILVESTTTSQGDYIDINMNMASQVNYINDNIALAPITTFNYDPASVSMGITTNIKRVSVTLTSIEPAFANKNITLSAFSCNIGAVTPDKTDQ
ncbi:MAG: hypothetical protein WC253_05575 [Sulfurovaceae bacterium]|jgi:hypothetical protein|nr:hypothetical protein [Sulfurovaceae bacterium]